MKKIEWRIRIHVFWSNPDPVFIKIQNRNQKFGLKICNHGIFIQYLFAKVRLKRDYFKHFKQLMSSEKIELSLKLKLAYPLPNYCVLYSG